MEKAIEEKQRLYKVFDKLKSTMLFDRQAVQEKKRKYDEAECIAKNAISKANEPERKGKSMAKCLISSMIKNKF